MMSVGSGHPEVAQIHGYRPGTVTPTTRLVLSHKHPDDYEHVAATLDEIRRTHKPFSTRHRIIDVQGHTREVIVIGERLHDNAGGRHARLLHRHDTPWSITASSNQRSCHRNRGKPRRYRTSQGRFDVRLRIEADAAFDLLKWRSQETNIKLRIMAEQLSEDIGNLQYGDVLPPRTVFDGLLITAHQRIRAKAANKRP
jgi:hypothetical protein